HGRGIRSAGVLRAAAAARAHARSALQMDTRPHARSARPHDRHDRLQIAPQARGGAPGLRTDCDRAQWRLSAHEPRRPRPLMLRLSLTARIALVVVLSLAAAWIGSVAVFYISVAGQGRSLRPLPAQVAALVE